MQPCDARQVEHLLEIAATRAGKPLLVGLANVVEIAGMEEIFAGSRHERTPLCQADASTPTHRVWLHLARLRIQQRGQLRPAWDDQLAVDDGHVSLR